MKTLRLTLMNVCLLAGTLPCLAAEERQAEQFPPADKNLVLAAPIRTWDEAIPLGQGLMGGLLWGEANLIRLSLDRGDLWDERPAVEKEWWKTRNWKVGGDWDGPYNGVTPTKLPAGRLEITLEPGQKVEQFTLNLATAEGLAKFSDGQVLRAFFSAVEPVALMRIPGPEPKAFDLIPASARKQTGSAGPSSGGAVSRLGYPPAKQGSEGSTKWYVQDAADGLKYCACIATRRVGDATLVAVTVTSSNDAADLLALARKRCSSALINGFDAELKPHVAWWQKFWARSSVTIPAQDIAISRQYYLVQYFHGAASRRGAPPMPLQGVWTADDGGLPPWKGDYHNDLNTQMTYIAYQGAGHFDEGACYLDFLWNLAPAFRAFAKDFYGTRGLACPGVMSLAGQPLGGWGQYSLSPTMSAWSAHLFYLHWRYTNDDEFLRTRAYPWCQEVGACMLELLKPDDKGRLKLLRSSSPEVFDNSARAWLEPNSNYDLMCLKMLFLSLQEMADACGRADEAKKWAGAAAAIGDFHADAAGTLLLDAKTPLPYSHRHLSNIIGLYPFNLITSDGDEKDLRRIKVSLAQWDKLGTSQWCGYSWSWMSCLRARVGDAESALRHLDVFVHAFILRNGFHVNGDQSGMGFSGMSYRPFTLEGNFLAAQAMQEMLLQSWSPAPGTRDTEVVRVFPATPWRWHDAAFEDLCAEGGHRASARRENNATTWLRVVAGKDGVVRIRDNFGGRTPRWSIPGVKKVGENFELAMKKGQTLEASLAKPATIPDAPADLAKPVVVRGSSRIGVNTLPLRIGADSNGGNCFVGDMARVAVFNRTLGGEEIAKLADKHNVEWVKVQGLVAAVPLPSGMSPALRMAEQGKVIGVKDVEGLTGNAIRFDGKSFQEIPNHDSLAGKDGLTLAAWIRPARFPPSGMRIIDKTAVGSAIGYLLDTYPGDSLRLITRDPHLVHAVKLPVGQWSHVAATVDGKTGRQMLYVNGKAVAEGQ